MLSLLLASLSVWSPFCGITLYEDGSGWITSVPVCLSGFLCSF